MATGDAVAGNAPTVVFVSSEMSLSSKYFCIFSLAVSLSLGVLFPAVCGHEV